jgi:hypothetical protein
LFDFAAVLLLIQFGADLILGYGRPLDDLSDSRHDTNQRYQGRKDQSAHFSHLFV